MLLLILDLPPKEYVAINYLLLEHVPRYRKLRSLRRSCARIFSHESSVAWRFEVPKACSVKWMELPTSYQRTERKATDSIHSDAI